MTDETIDLSNLDDAIGAVYRGALEDFVRRRDALAKQLRADKRRQDAERVKALRKPSKTAWALNNVPAENAASIDQLAAAIESAQEAQARGGGDVRAALENLRTAVREVAHAAARASIRVGNPVDATDLVAAVNAVIGDANAFAELRAGRLSEIPSRRTRFPNRCQSLEPGPVYDEERRPPPARGAPDVAAHEELERAGASMREARARARAADRTLADAEERLAAAEVELQRARREVEGARAELERAQQQAGDAASEVQQAEQVVADLQAGVD
jgi:chromosome segregation ATPase